MTRTRRRPYRKSRAFDASCRCHGGCPWCYENRMHATRKRLAACAESERELWQMHASTLLACHVQEE